jgi:hypothetical protein
VREAGSAPPEASPAGVVTSGAGPAPAGTLGTFLSELFSQSQAAPLRTGKAWGG